MSTTQDSAASTPPMPRTPSNIFSEQSVTIAQDDLAVLELLTNDQIQGIGTHAHSAIESPDDALAVESNTTNTIKKDTRFKRRDADFDPLLFVAAVASGPHVTRHHYHHNFNPLDEDYFWNWEKREGYVNGSDEDDENVRPKYISKQAPRSERVRLLRERRRNGQWKEHLRGWHRRAGVRARRAARAPHVFVSPRYHQAPMDICNHCLCS